MTLFNALRGTAASSSSRHAMQDATNITVVAEDSPGLLIRVLQPFAKRDVTPDHVQAVRQGGTIRIRIGLHALERDTCERILGDLTRIFGILEMREDREASREIAAA